MRTWTGLRVGATVLGLLVGGVLGCGDKGPKTYPVNGKVVFKGKPGKLDRLMGGRVVFQSVADPKVMAVGILEDDGSFSMVAQIPSENKGYTGVLAGDYKARLDLPLDDDNKPVRGLVHPKYLDFDKSGLKYTVPTSGDIVVEVETPSR